MTDLAAWANRIVADWPPLTAAEAASVGRLAAILRARIAECELHRRNSGVGPDDAGGAEADN